MSENDFWLNVREICGRHGHGKNEGRTIDISKNSAQHECMSEQLLKVSVPYSTGVATTTPPPLACLSNSGALAPEKGGPDDTRFDWLKFWTNLFAI